MSLRAHLAPVDTTMAATVASAILMDLWVGAPKMSATHKGPPFVLFAHLIPCVVI